MEMGCSVEVLVLYAKEIDEIDEVIIEIPSELIAQFERTFKANTESNEAITYLATREYIKHMQPNQIREALIKGYVEMSQINLTICSECLHAEYEAEHMVERLVSGG
jgi:CopG family transcriptional regulator / antitoxin EndoAI